MTTRVRRSAGSKQFTGKRAAGVRAGFARRMADGETFCCPFCGRRVDPARPWDVDHATPMVLGGQVWAADQFRPSHASCNRRAGAKVGNRLRAQRRRARAARPAAPTGACAGCGDPAPDWLCPRCADVVAG